MQALVSFYSLSKKDLQNALAKAERQQTSETENSTDQLQNLFKERLEQRSHLKSKELFLKVYKKNLHKKELFFDNLGKETNAWIKSFLHFNLPLKIEKVHVSQGDGSVKFVLKLLHDNLFVEAVLIPERSRLTLCISSQVGCSQGCRFCQTGRMGLKRSLMTEEIVGQLQVVDSWRKENTDQEVGQYKKITNIVFMGMGEPLDNLDNVMKAVDIFCDPHAFFLSHNRVTISTVGLLPALEKLLLDSPAAIALSLHSPFEEERTRVMPVNQAHPLHEVLAVLKKHLALGSRKNILIQYILLRGVNDSQRHMQELICLLQDIRCKINLIPLNEHEGSAYRRPDLSKVYSFQQGLKLAGLVATVRISKGRDINAACGQLINKFKDIPTRFTKEQDT